MRSIMMLALTTCSVAAFSQNSFSIHGVFQDMAVMPQKVYLFRDTLSGLAPDSAVVSNGRYEFTGHFDAPSPAYITLSPSVKGRSLFLPGKNIAETDQLPLFIDKGRISIETHSKLDQSSVTGSAADAESREVNRGIHALIDAVRSLAVLFHETDDQMVYNEVTDMIFSMDRIERADYIPYIRVHPSAAIDVWLLNDLLTLKQSAGYIDTLQRLYTLLPEGSRKSAAGKLAAERLERESRSAIGHNAADLTLPDSNGVAVNLRGLRGKYVFIHFWHSEGGMQDMYTRFAYLSKAYKDYKDQGLVVMGVGLDSDRQQWMKTLHEQKLAWPQVYDAGGMSGAAAKAFGIEKNHRNVLIDPNGVIIARDLDATEIDKFLAPIFQ